MLRRKLSLKARRGSTLVLVGILMVGFVAVGAIAADMGRFYTVATELQTAADAAAIRGAVKLLNTPGTSVESQVDGAVVSWVLSANKADNRGLSVSADNVTMKYYTPGTGGAQGTIVNVPSGTRPNAVTVVMNIEPRGFFAKFLGRYDSVYVRREATAWVASLGSNCVRPWAFPYLALYRDVSGNTGQTSPAPDLDPAQFSQYMQRLNTQRFFTIVGQNQTTTLANDGEWNGFNFTGNAGKSSFVDGINGCTSTKINPDAGQGVTLPGQADQYVNWSVDAVFGGGNGANYQDGICKEKAPGNAGCYVTPADTAPGVTINSAWGELLGNGSNGIDFDYVGEFVVTCFYRASTDVCPTPEPGTQNTGYPPGTIIGYIKTLKSRYITTDDVFGNFATNLHKIVLVK